jgi:hypothetical protein
MAMDEFSDLICSCRSQIVITTRQNAEGGAGDALLKVAANPYD